jgi:putative toxin-antitoxin system antitoxin component (TIGR02293 family)
LTHRDNLVTITISTAFSRIRGDQGAWFHRSTRLTSPINLIDTGQPVKPLADAWRIGAGRGHLSILLWTGRTRRPEPRRTPEQGALDWVASERLDRLVEVIRLAYGVFEQPASTEAWLKAPHPLLHQISPLQHCRTAIGAGQVRRLLQALEQGAPA